MINVNTSVSMQKRKYLCNFGASKNAIIFAKMQTFLQKREHFFKNANIFANKRKFVPKIENMCKKA